ncbi:response regulator [Pontivivens insulae]|uniref:Response regulatory domain-containing protein n=1 Tax=Pontivivens insulae TaxID=1639689 RepID=A0A2R8AAQ5_9RHOB|nr:response regulator [Pontivivens insulae]RED13194.1 response regulator receiver domain-containing protein [Pontivivens insulae]SPF29286.1 hypothetical protein POI8812_01594 [Pontivivens insulae]
MPNALAGQTILLAEDEPLIALNLEMVLEEEGATVIAVTHIGRTDHVDPGKISGAILDVQLADGEVYDLADRLYAEGVPIVFHSGHAERTDLLTRYPGARALTKAADEDLLVKELTHAC